MTIRAKLYTAIVLTILGPLATTAVALHGMAQLGDRFDEVREDGSQEATALQLKFDGERSARRRPGAPASD